MRCSISPGRPSGATRTAPAPRSTGWRRSTARRSPRSCVPARGRTSCCRRSRAPSRRSSRSQPGCARRVLRPLLARGVVPVVPGFLGAAPDGQAVTLGRGGSDLTATLLARALGAREVSLWKDVPGVLTADPRIVPDARVIPQLHVREAAELAYYGA